jgi:hypothetical protein
LHTQLPLWLPRLADQQAVLWDTPHSLLGFGEVLGGCNDE